MPERSKLVSALESHDLFIYFGHGGGEKFLPPKALWQQERCPAALLMVSSSHQTTVSNTVSYDARSRAVVLSLDAISITGSFLLFEIERFLEQELFF